MRCIEVIALASRACPLSFGSLRGLVGVAADTAPFVVSLDRVHGRFPLQGFQPWVRAVGGLREFASSIESLIRPSFRLTVLPVKAKDLRVVVEEVANAVGEEDKRPKVGSGANLCSPKQRKQRARRSFFHAQMKV